MNMDRRMWAFILEMEISLMPRQAAVLRLTTCTAVTGAHVISERAALCDNAESGEGHSPSFFIGVQLCQICS